MQGETNPDLKKNQAIIELIKKLHTLEKAEFESVIRAFATDQMNILTDRKTLREIVEEISANLASVLPSLSAEEINSLKQDLDSSAAKFAVDQIV